MLALVEQPADIGRLIDVVAIVFADLAEGLNADGQFAFSSWTPSSGRHIYLACQARSTSNAARLRVSLLNSTAIR